MGRVLRQRLLMVILIGFYSGITSDRTRLCLRNRCRLAHPLLQLRAQPVAQVPWVGRWTDYAYGEKTYLVLRLVAKSLLAWQIFGGSLAG